MSSGTVKIVLKNGTEIAAKLKKLHDIGGDIAEQTVKDVKSRAPAWIGKGIRTKYNIGVAEAKGGKDVKLTTSNSATIKVTGKKVAGLAFRYEGRNLTPVESGGAKRFSVKRAGKLFNVTVTKGRTRPIKKSAPLPFQLLRANARNQLFYRAEGTKNKLHIMRLISVPQMIQSKGGHNNPLTEAAIKAELEKGIASRLDHFKSRGQKKIDSL
jgi:hypothetical protein